MNNETQYYGYPVSNQAKAEKQLDDSLKLDVVEQHDAFWLNDDCLREGIQEASWDERVFELMRKIKFEKTDAIEETKLRSELAALMVDNVDNYLFKVAEAED